MKSEYHKHDKTNAIQLRAIYDIGVGIAKSFIDSKSEEVFLWNEDLYGKWPLDTKRKEVKSILKNLGDEESLQPCQSMYCIKFVFDLKETAINVILSNLIIFGKYKIDASA